MKNIAYQAEECNGDSTASTKNNAAFVESAFDESVLNSGHEGEEKRQKVHSFSRKLAKEIQAKKRKKNPKAKHAGHEATLLKYLANRVRASKNIVDGKAWFYLTVDELLKVFPYLGRTTIYDLLMSLQELGYLEIGNHNRYKYDRTLWFHVPKAVCDATEEDLLYFDAAVAEDAGLVGAVLQRNFDYHIKQCEEKKLPLQVSMSPAVFVELLPFGESTIKRGLKSLEGKYLHKLSTSDAIYGIPRINRGSYPNEKGPNPNDKGSYPNGKGPNPNNDTYWKTVINPLESSSKVKPAVLVLVNSSDDKEAKDEQIHLLHEDIATFADEQDRKEMRHDKNALPGSDLSHSPVQSETTKASHYEVLSPGDEIAMCSTQEPKHANPFSSSSSDISVEDEHVKGEWPEVADYEFLRNKNRSSAAFADRLEKMPGMKEKLWDTVELICREVLSKLDWETLDELCASGDPEGVLSALLPFHRAFFEKGTIDPSISFFDILFFGSLEAMVGAIVWTEKRHDFYSHAISMLSHVTYKIHLIFWRRAEDLREKAIKEEFSQWKIEFASVDVHKEAEALLSPAEKMRVFRNAINSMNEVGWIWFDQTHQTNRINVNKVGRARIQKLFELNPDLTPADLLPIMKACMKEYASRPAPPRKFKRGVQWHARMAHRLDIFASYLKTIVKQLGINSPVKVYPGDEDTSDEPTTEEQMAMAA